MEKRSIFSEIKLKVEKYERRYPNKPRLVIFRLICWLVGKFKGAQPAIPSHVDKPKSSNSKEILFKLHGGMGDVIINLNYLNKFIQTFGQTFTVYLTGKNQIVSELYGDKFKLLNDFEIEQNRFVLIIDLVRFPRIIQNFGIEDDQLKHWVQSCEKFQHQNMKLFQNCPENDGISNKLAQLLGCNRVKQPDILNFFSDLQDSRIELNSKTNSQEVLNRLNLTGKKIVTVNRACEVSLGQKESTKMWPSQYYEQLLWLLKRDFPDLIFVQLGTSKAKTVVLKNIDVDLIGKTSLEDIKVLMKNAFLHIDNEGGLVHLRHFINRAPSIVFFGPTDPTFYGYSENLNLQAKQDCLNCEWVSNDWIQKCIKNGKTCSDCLRGLEVQYVYKQIHLFLEREKIKC